MHYSPLQKKQEDASETDATITIAANPEDARITSNSQCCKIMRKGPEKTLIVQCAKCGSKNTAVIKKVIEGESHLRQKSGGRRL